MFSLDSTTPKIYSNRLKTKNTNQIMNSTAISSPFETSSLHKNSHPNSQDISTIEKDSTTPKQIQPNGSNNNNNLTLVEKLNKIRNGSKPDDKKDKIRGLKLGLAYFEDKKYNESKNYIVKYLEVYPKDYTAHTYLARCYIELKMNKLAKNSYEEALRLNNNGLTNPVLLLEYCKVLYYLDGSREKIINLLTKATTAIHNDSSNKNFGNLILSSSDSSSVSIKGDFV